LARASPFLSFGLGIFQKSAGSVPVPMRANHAFPNVKRLGGIPVSPLLIGIILATGFPLSVTTTSSPAFTFNKYSLSDVFNLETAAVFIN
jgi:hypothetical protein